MISSSGRPFAHQINVTLIFETFFVPLEQTVPCTLHSLRRRWVIGRLERTNNCVVRSFNKLQVPAFTTLLIFYFTELFLISDYWDTLLLYARLTAASEESFREISSGKWSIRMAIHYGGTWSMKCAPFVLFYFRAFHQNPSYEICDCVFMSLKVVARCSSIRFKSFFEMDGKNSSTEEHLK